MARVGLTRRERARLNLRLARLKRQSALDAGVLRQPRSQADRAGLDGLKTVLRTNGKFESSPDRSEIKQRLMSQVEHELDRKLQYLSPDQGLALFFRVELMRRDGSFLQQPEARWSSENRTWRNAVTKAANGTCQDCGTRQGPFHAHHVKSWKDHEALRFDVANGVLICVPCHAARHPDRAALILSLKAGERNV